MMVESRKISLVDVTYLPKEIQSAYSYTGTFYNELYSRAFFCGRTVKSSTALNSEARGSYPGWEMD
jgi:hypothetical protein